MPPSPLIGLYTCSDARRLNLPRRSDLLCHCFTREGDLLSRRPLYVPQGFFRCFMRSCLVVRAIIAQTAHLIKFFPLCHVKSEKFWSRVDLMVIDLIRFALKENNKNKQRQRYN